MKHTLTLLTALLLAPLTSLRADYAQEITRDGPSAWWRFAIGGKDEFGNHPAMMHDVAFEAGVPGIGGKSVRFDGVKSYVEIANHTDFELNSLSVELWFRSSQKWTASGWPASATLVSKGTKGAGSSDWAILGGAAEGKEGCVMSRPGPKGGNDVVLASPEMINDGAWHHVVWTRPADGENKLYVDGGLAATCRDSGGAITNSRPIQIGGDPWLGGKSFAGEMAEIAIYKTALTAEHVATHVKAAGIEPKEFSDAQTTATLATEPKIETYIGPIPGPNVKDQPGWKETAATEKDADKFVPLFDDKTFNGWEGTPKRWRIEDGAIVGGSLTNGGESDYLCTVRDFTNFEMRLQWKTVQVGTNDVNGGIQIRTRRLKNNTQVTGYQADLGTLKGYLAGKFWGCLFDNTRRNKILAGDPVANEKLVKMGDWNDYVIRCEGPRIRLWLNGQQTVDFTEADEKIPLSGIIGVQVHSGPAMEIWYRNIKIKELPQGTVQTSPRPLSPPMPMVLKTESFKHYVEDFNRNDNELYRGYFPNAAAWDFLKANVPLLDCPDEKIQRTYYFRWWTYRKHIKQTPVGWIVDEFLPPVGWAGKFNSINCAAGHHLYEGRWLRDPQYLDDYSAFWFGKGGDVRRYSFWVADAVWQRYCVTGDPAMAIRLLPDLIANFAEWEKTHRDANGLYWQMDDRDGMEDSISGALHPKQLGYRATINSYQFGDALAIARIAELAGQPDVAREYREKAATIKKLVQEELWDADARFFKVIPRDEEELSDARELHGYTPWYVNLPDPQYAVAWKQVMDPKGFFAPFGLTTAEQRHPKFALSYTGHDCQWNGPVWPFSTAITLTGLANLLNGAAQDVISAKDYFELLRIYATSHQLKLDDGRVVPWIDEDQNPTNGDWIARTLLIRGGSKIPERGKDYNHSTFCDLVISGLIGLRPRADETVEVNPLVPEGTWDYFCLDQIRYHEHWLTILFDKSGERYGKGKGLRVFSDGKEIAAADKLTRVTGKLSAPSEVPGPETAGGWKKFDGNPVMGGKYGTCFDISVLRDGDKYRMWLSWRPKGSVALVESSDGIRWSEPPQVVLGPRKETGWEDVINRPFVLKREDGYHMWYTGQVKPGAKDGHSWIGYATSPDGVTWKRMSDKPVLSFDQPWELNIAVMCPSVIWDEQTKLFQMWYSGGEQNEPNAVGYATSPDGLTWTKCAANPVFSAEPKNWWEKHKVAGVQVIKTKDWYLMFYIGYETEPLARICLARSKDGITNWQRHPANPIVFPGKDKWDHDACYKPYAIFDGTKWLLWYNGRHGSLEQIGVVFHQGEDLGFDQ